MVETTTNQTNPVSPLTGGSDIVGEVTGKESSLSSYVGPYVTEMLGKGQALANEGYNAYMGPLTAYTGRCIWWPSTGYNGSRRCT